MKIHVEQDGLKAKAVKIIADNFDKAKAIKGDELNSLVDMAKGE